MLLNYPVERAEAVANRIRGDPLYAPHLLDLEVTNTLRRLVFAREVARARAEAVLSRLAESPIVRYPHYAFLPRIWKIRDNLTPYDASYGSGRDAECPTDHDRRADVAGGLWRQDRGF